MGRATHTHTHRGLILKAWSVTPEQGGEDQCRKWSFPKQMLVALMTVPLTVLWTDEAGFCKLAAEYDMGLSSLLRYLLQYPEKGLRGASKIDGDENTHTRTRYKQHTQTHPFLTFDNHNTRKFAKADTAEGGELWAGAVGSRGTTSI